MRRPPKTLQGVKWITCIRTRLSLILLKIQAQYATIEKVRFRTTCGLLLIESVSSVSTAQNAGKPKLNVIDVHSLPWNTENMWTLGEPDRCHHAWWQGAIALEKLFLFLLSSQSECRNGARAVAEEEWLHARWLQMRSGQLPASKEYLEEVVERIALGLSKQVIAPRRQNLLHCWATNYPTEGIFCVSCRLKWKPFRHEPEDET